MNFHQACLTGLLLAMASSQAAAYDVFSHQIRYHARQSTPVWARHLFRPSVRNHLRITKHERHDLLALFDQEEKDFRTTLDRRSIQSAINAYYQKRQPIVGMEITKLLGKERTRRLKQIYWQTVSRDELKSLLISRFVPIDQDFDPEVLKDLQSVLKAREIRMQAIEEKRQQLQDLNRSQTLYESVRLQSGFQPRRLEDAQLTRMFAEAQRQYKKEMAEVDFDAIWNHFLQMRGKPFDHPQDLDMVR